MLKKILLFTVVLIFVSITLVFAAVIDLPVTGQTKCYDTSGTEVTCTGTGQDGEYQAGTGWPSPRFTKIYCDAIGPCANQAADCDGNASTDMIKDNLTGLIWARDGDLPASLKYWADGLTYANDLTLCGHSDWRLPNVNELGSLYNSGQSDLNAWLASQGFVNVYMQQSPGYWSSTSVDTTTGPGVRAWVLEGGSIIGSPKSRGGIDLRPLWPVRGTTNGVAKIPQTGQTTCYDAAGAVISCAGTGQDGEFMEGVAWPAPRFTVVYCDDNGPCADQELDCDASESNDLVLDNLTSLVWTKDANLPAGTETWADALTYANNASVCGYTDWRIPNREEFRSLANYGTSDLPVWLNVEGGFINVPLQTNNCLYWTSTTSASSTGKAWFFGIRAYPYSNEYLYGSIAPMVKTEPWYVWPVRGGQSCSAPTAPDLISPLNVAAGVSLTPTLDWNDVSGATSYEVQVCSDNVCLSPISSVIVTDSQWTVTPALSPCRPYYWRVKAINACGSGLWSNVWNFTTISTPPIKPVLSTPANGATGVSTTPTLDWNDVSGAASYKVQICTDSSCLSIVRTATPADSEWTVSSSLKPGKTYYWRVKAINTCGSSLWSSIWHFTTACPTLDPPILSGPSNGPGASVTPTLDWNDVVGATAYRVQVCTDSSCFYVVATALTTSSQWTVSPALSPTTTYYWRVKAKNSCRKSEWSTFRWFKTKPTITVVSPNGGDNLQTGTQTTISWTYTGNPGQNVKIELFKSGVLNRTITASTPIGTGLFQWLIKSTQQTGCDYKIKITSTTNANVADKSDLPFCINQ